MSISAAISGAMAAAVSPPSSGIAPPIAAINLRLTARNVSTAVPGHASTTHLRKRHSKRHSNWYDYHHFNENSSSLEWDNPCGGVYVPTAALGSGSVRWKRKTPMQIYNNLKKSVGKEFKTLNGSQQEIDISNIQIWLLHDYTYKFLPKLKRNSSIALKRWYRNVKTYVASFAYLRRIQLNWDHSKSQRESRTARELKHLLLHSRSMLCDLEMAVNNTRPNQQLSLPQITRSQMNKRLKLRSKRNEAVHNIGDVYEADTIDLIFVKYYYYEFLETMWNVLRQNTKRKGQKKTGIVARTRNGSISMRKNNSNHKRLTNARKS